MGTLKRKQKLYDLEQEKKEIKEKYERAIREVDMKITKVKESLALDIGGVDVQRVENARRFIYIYGLEHFGPGESSLVLKALEKTIIENPNRLKTYYYGCKEYAGFDLQSIECKYGYGPTYGTVVWEIGATNMWRKGEIDLTESDLDDIMYYLQVIRNPETRKLLLPQ